jgi:ABC-2 type transport system permease protein
MRNVLLIAKREYLEQIRGRAFKLSTVLLPLVFVIMVGAGFLTGHQDLANKHLAIAADNPTLAEDIRRQMTDDKDIKFTVAVVAPATDTDIATLQKQVQNKTIDGLLILQTSASGTPTAAYTSRSSNDYIITNRLRDALNRSLLNERLAARGITKVEADVLLKNVAIKTLQINKDGQAPKHNGNVAIYKGMVMAFLLTMTTLLYGLDLARSIIEEKSSRIFEVMLAVARPDDMLAGKLIGVGAVGLTQISIWVAAAMLLAASGMATSLLTGDFAIHISLLEAVLFPLYFVLGFFLFSALFSGLAATCETAQELQMYMPLAAAPVWLSFGTFPLLLNDSNSTWAIIASFFPPTAPFVMMLRLGVGPVPIWQLLVSIALMLLAIWAVLWFSSRLYRVGILMYGKRATLPELLRWLRYT